MRSSSEKQWRATSCEVKTAIGACTCVLEICKDKNNNNSDGNKTNN